MTEEAFSDESLIIARLGELVDHRTPWHRSLWQIGSMLCLREVLEYADGVRTNVARSEGLAYVTQSAATNLKRDFGLGGGAVRSEIIRILECGVHKTDGVLNQSVAASMDQLIRRVERDYLSNWADAHSASAVVSRDVEFMARAVVAHMLDAGFSADHLHGWLLAIRDDHDLNIASVMEQASEMFRREPVTYEVYVPFTKLPSEIAGAAGDRFQAWDDLVAELATEGWPPLHARSGVGALKLQITAREPKAAIAAAEIEIRRLSARAAVGLASGEVAPEGSALVCPAARPRWKKLHSWQSEIRLSSITRHNLLLPVDRSQGVRALDDAFELLAAAETATSWTSVAAMWAAVEGLLTRPGEPGVTAADRMAAVVAGGFVRAELTQLVDVLAAVDDDLGALLRSDLRLTSKMDALMGAVEGATPPVLSNPTDAAALARIHNVLADPGPTTTRVRGYYQDAFRRLYMQRNLLLHGGRFDSVALSATMRTLPALVAAGLDRLVHAAVQVPATDPFALAARAENELNFQGTPDARALYRLLD